MAEQDAKEQAAIAEEQEAKATEQAQNARSVAAGGRGSRSRRREASQQAAEQQADLAAQSQADAEQQAANAKQQRAEAQRQKEIAQKQESAAQQQAAIAKRARARAVAEARIAEGRAFAATALTELSTDPELAVRDALQAARLDPESAEDVLRKSLAASRVRAVLPSGGGDAQGASSRANRARMLTAGSGAGDAQDASFSANGALILTAGSGGEARIFNARTSSLVRVLKVGSFIRAASFSPDGRLVATASRDGFARLWSVQSGDRPPHLATWTRRHEPCLLSGRATPGHRERRRDCACVGRQERETAPAPESPAGCHYGVV